MKSRFNHISHTLNVLLLLTLFSQVLHAEFVDKDQWSRSTVTGSAGAKEVLIKLSGLDADADLYVSKAQQPSLTAFDCRPALDSTHEEICLIALADGETANIGVYGVEPASFFVETLPVESMTPVPGEPKPLILGRLTAGSVQSNQFTYFVFDSSSLPALTDEYLLPSEQNYQGFGVEFVARLTGLSADADLLVGIGELPTKTNGEDRCPSNKQGGTNNEQCGVFLKDLKGRPVFVGVFGANTSATYKIQGLIQKTINVSPANIKMVGKGFSETAKVLKDQWNYYQINPDQVASATSISVTMKPLDDDVDLYVRTQAPPIALHWDCFANLSGVSQEVCTINNIVPDQSFYFGVFGFTASDYTISVSIQ